MFLKFDKITESLTSEYLQENMLMSKSSTQRYLFQILKLFFSNRLISPAEHSFQKIYPRDK
jgi:hypothetical protein